jgi:hypothetical protein
MNLPTNGFPGTAAPQAQLARVKKKLTKLSDQLTVLSDRARLLGDDATKKILARATSNTITAHSFGEAVDSIASQSALDLLTAPDNGVQVNVALTAFEDVPEVCNLKPVATSIAAVVLEEKLPVSENKAGGMLNTDQPRRFTCCSPDPSKYFGELCSTPGRTAPPLDVILGPVGTNTCEQPSYVAIVLPVHISTSKERVDELLAMSELLITRAQAQVGQARQALCHASGEETCSLF